MEGGSSEASTPDALPPRTPLPLLRTVSETLPSADRGRDISCGDHVEDRYKFSFNGCGTVSDARVKRSEDKTESSEECLLLNHSLSKLELQYNETGRKHMFNDLSSDNCNISGSSQHSNVSSCVNFDCKGASRTSMISEDTVDGSLIAVSSNNCSFVNSKDCSSSNSAFTDKNTIESKINISCTNVFNFDGIDKSVSNVFVDDRDVLVKESNSGVNASGNRTLSTSIDCKSSRCRPECCGNTVKNQKLKGTTPNKRSPEDRYSKRTKRATRRLTSSNQKCLSLLAASGKFKGGGSHITSGKASDSEGYSSNSSSTSATTTTTTTTPTTTMTASSGLGTGTNDRKQPEDSTLMARICCGASAFFRNDLHISHH